MNRVIRISLTTILSFSACVAFAQSAPQESLGDYARAVKKTKSTPAASDQKKVYDNDNLPTTASISVVGNVPATPEVSTKTDQAPDADAPAEQAGSSDEKKDDKKEPELKPGQSPDERDKALHEWKEKLDAQNEKVALFARELDLLQREYRVKSAEFYANTANLAQNPAGFAKDDADYKQQIADKQKALDDAKSKLSAMQEEARRAGAPDSVTAQN